jgi:hypothetical protein
MRKKMVDAASAIDINQNEYPTKSPDWSIPESPEAASVVCPTSSSDSKAPLFLANAYFMGVSLLILDFRFILLNQPVSVITLRI